MVKKKYFKTTFSTNSFRRRLYSSLSNAQNHLYDGFPHSLQSKLPPDFGIKLEKAKHDCLDSLKRFDKSSELLSHYIPGPAQLAFTAIKCFNIEMNKINIGGARTSKVNNALNASMGFSTVDLKFKFWEEILQKLSTGEVIAGGESIALLLQEAILNDLHVDVSYLSTFIANRKAYLKDPSFRCIDNICSYGEGTYSQLNYMIQGLLLSPGISPSTISLIEHSPIVQSLMTDIAAHIGQATAVATMITGVGYYAKAKDQITLPIDILAKNNLSEEAILRLFQGHVDKNSKEFREITAKLKDSIFETSITANDHVLTSKQKFNQLTAEIEQVLDNTDDPLLINQSKSWLKNMPDALYIPFMSILPIELYLKKLEQNDFDIFSKSLTVKDWKLAWKSYWNYNHRLL